jgi:hypothetical protein
MTHHKFNVDENTTVRYRTDTFCGKEFKVIEAFGNGTCLFYSLLFIGSPSYRKLPDEQKIEVGKIFRKNMFHKHNERVKPPFFSANHDEFVTEDTLLFLGQYLKFNVAALQKGSGGVAKNYAIFDAAIPTYFTLFNRRSPPPNQSDHFEPAILGSNTLMGKPTFDSFKCTLEVDMYKISDQGGAVEEINDLVTEAVQELNGNKFGNVRLPDKTFDLQHDIDGAIQAFEATIERRTYAFTPKDPTYDTYDPTEHPIAALVTATSSTFRSLEVYPIDLSSGRAGSTNVREIALDQIRSLIGRCSFEDFAKDYGINTIVFDLDGNMTKTENKENHRYFVFKEYELEVEKESEFGERIVERIVATFPLMCENKYFINL